ncbi:MAG: purine-nucleoside phosphorylase [Ignavibacteriaceae bacterium]
MIDLNFKYKDLTGQIKSISPFEPELALILGSGLGDFADKINIIKSVNTGEFPGYPPSTIAGHAGKIHFAEYEGKKLIIFQGRIHFYEGYKIYECILPVWITYKLNCKKMFITNAAGGINFNFKPGDLMLANSFIGMSIKKELTYLTGLSSIEIKNMSLDFPSGYFNNIIKKAALDEKIELKEGVYWYTKGPSYETPAEIKMMRILGADAVGMSTVHEAAFSAYLGMAVSSVTCITNFGSGISPKKLSHLEVTETANLVTEKFEKLVKRIIKTL